MQSPVSGKGLNFKVPREDVTEKVTFSEELNEVKEQYLRVSWRRNLGRESKLDKDLQPGI